MTDEQRADEPGDLDLTTLERVIAVGDLSELKPEERFNYYLSVCRSVGLNPVTQPFKYVRQQGQLKLYATKEAADQLRCKHRITIEFGKPDKTADVMYVKARAKMPGGRSDEDIGAVNLANARGESLANALMKCHTKAKRRVTLSICGLGFVADESELETMGTVETVSMAEAQGRVPEERPSAVPAPIPQPSQPAHPPAPPPSAPKSETRHVDEPPKGSPEDVCCEEYAAGAGFHAENCPTRYDEYDDPPIPFEPEPEPERARPPVQDNQSLAEVYEQAMGVAKDMKELSGLAQKIMELRFEEHELERLRAAYLKRKRELQGQ